MVYKFSTLLLLLSTLLWTSCSNEIDVTAEYKDITVVYGIINPNDSVQSIKIYKAFLGDENAYIMAEKTDSFYYQNILDVTLERWKNNMLSGIIELTRDSTLTMEPGIFGNAPNITYKTKNNDSIYADSDYRLVIKNRTTGAITFAQTTVINKFIAFNAYEPIVDLWLKPFRVIWYHAQDAQFYQVYFNFHYTEQSKATGQSVDKVLSWYLGEVNSSGTSVGSPFVIDILPNQFYTYLAVKMEPDANINRFVGYVDFVYKAGNKNLYEYYTVNNNPNTLLQTTPAFTNINNGLGVFGSQSSTSVYNRTLSQRSIDSLIYGRFTKNLGF